MEIQQLRYVVAVADELHFGRAAERLGVAQQSVSDQVRRLEREFGIPLFVRTSRKVAPTTAGAAFVLAARRALLAIDEAAATVHRVASGTTGKLRIGYADDLGQRLIHHTVPRLRQLEAPIRVEPVPMSTPQQLVALSERQLDLAFGWTPDLTEGFAALLVTRDPLVLAVAADHPLAALRTVPPKELSGRPVIIAPRAVNPRLYERTISQLVSEGAVVDVHQEIAGLARMLPLVLAGAAIAITCSTTAEANPAAGIRYLEFSDPVPWVDHTLVWRADDTSPAVRSFVSVVRDVRDEGAFLPSEFPAAPAQVDRTSTRAV